MNTGPLWLFRAATVHGTAKNSGSSELGIPNCSETRTEPTWPVDLARQVSSPVAPAHQEATNWACLCEIYQLLVASFEPRFTPDKSSQLAIAVV